MASASPADKVAYVEEKPTDGGVYELIDGQWYCCICRAFAPESHRYCKNHLWYVQQHREGKLRPIYALQDMHAAGQTNSKTSQQAGHFVGIQDMHAAGHWTSPPPNAPPPPPGQQTDGLSGPPPAPTPAAVVSEENVILVKLHTKLDIILDKLQSVEARLAVIERALCGWAWQ